MNKQRRAAIEKVKNEIADLNPTMLSELGILKQQVDEAVEKYKGKLEDLKGELESLKGEEDEYKDNMPENMQSGEKYQNAEQVVSELDSAIDNLDTAISEMDDMTFDVEGQVDQTIENVLGNIDDALNVS